MAKLPDGSDKPVFEGCYLGTMTGLACSAVIDGMSPVISGEFIANSTTSTTRMKRNHVARLYILAVPYFNSVRPPLVVL